METDYTKREIDILMKEIHESLGRIEKQVIKTNARVSSLEKWRWALMGALAIVAWIIANNMLNINSII